jgi:ABC-type nitrate/sulfonate/bicarbonate transport system ATPase subunit
MTMALGEVISPALSAMLDRLVTTIASGSDTVLVGPSGCGLSTAANLVISKLEEHAVASVLMDCRMAVSWQEECRRVGEAAEGVHEGLPSYP